MPNLRITVARRAYDTADLEVSEWRLRKLRRSSEAEILTWAEDALGWNKDDEYPDITWMFDQNNYEGDVEVIAVDQHDDAWCGICDVLLEV